MESISCHITPLILYNLGGRHTNTHIHTHIQTFADRSNPKKLGRRAPGLIKMI